jgi:hypothetical protein
MLCYNVLLIAINASKSQWRAPVHTCQQEHCWAFSSQCWGLAGAHLNPAVCVKNSPRPLASIAGILGEREQGDRSMNRRRLRAERGTMASAAGHSNMSRAPGGLRRDDFDRLRSEFETPVYHKDRACLPSRSRRRPHNHACGYAIAPHSVAPYARHAERRYSHFSTAASRVGEYCYPVAVHQGSD